MTRLFDEHIKRHVCSLDGTWSFKTDSENLGEREEWYKSELSGEAVIVPSVWNTKLGLLQYEGACWYEKTFYTEGGTYRLHFGAVMTYARVYFDGEYIGEHYGGFTSFDFILNNLAAGVHRLTVRVDNSFDEASIPQAYVDWFHYGGITRSVSFERLSGIAALRCRLDYKLFENEAKCALTFEAYNAENREICDTVRVFVDNVSVTEKKIALAPFEKRLFVTDEFILSGVELWSPKSPKLYTLKIETECDDLYDRVGFRFIEARDRAIYINGEEFKPLGVNRHEEHPDFGMAFPPALMRRDIDLIKSLNANSIRGSHYPNNKIFVDMLDELGITFWSEIPIWGGGFTAEALGNPKVILRAEKMLDEMLWQYYNHPSIIIWGMHNEILLGTDEAYEMSKRFYAFLKENGGNRLVTYASDKHVKDICLEFCDVVCANVYCGWYETPFKDFEDFLTRYSEFLKSVGAGEKPVMITEFGAAAIYGNHTVDNIPWSEEYQAELLMNTINSIFTRDGFVGSYVWQFSDIRTAKQLGLNRARGFNNKGIVNEYRKPKLAYNAVKRVYEKWKK